MPPVPADLAGDLGDRYRLERELGRGGMAMVYLARDLKHGRSVAIKVLHPELGTSLGTERFLREIRLTASLDHPHILALLDSGVAAGRLYYVMPFVDGETLRDRLRRETQLPVKESVRIAGQIADALEYAHRRGIVHRDIKPENILLASNHARVADFGVARAVEAAADQQLTGTGLALGTPAYMSPEQASGGPVDSRSDVYALGCVLYEMLAGEPPFTGPTPQAVIAKRFVQPVTPVGALRDGVPPAVEAAVATALSRTPADRFPTAEAFRAALGGGDADGSPQVTTRVTSARPAKRRLGALLATGLALGAVAAAGLLLRSGRPARASAMPTLAVLPFTHTGPAQQQYLADGLADEIRNGLTSLADLRVISSASSAPLANTTEPPARIAEKLGVSHLLYGRVEPAGADTAGPVKVTAELVEARSGTVSWRRAVTVPPVQMLQVRGDLAAGVAGALRLPLTAAGREALEAEPTANLAAYEAYRRGADILLGTSAAVRSEAEKAVAHLERAVALDSSFALGWARLAMARALVAHRRDPAALERARTEAERALRLSPGLPAAYRSLVFYHAFTKNKARALEAAAEGLRFAPNHPELLRDMAAAEEDLGLWERARERRLQGAHLEPYSPGAARGLALNGLFLRRYEEAAPAADHFLQLAPTNPLAYHLAVMIALGKGDSARARALVREGESKLERDAFLSYMASNRYLFWVLDSAGQRRLASLTPAQFGQDTAEWALTLAALEWSRGNRPRARAHAREAKRVLAPALRTEPDDALAHGDLGLALAILGEADSALKVATAAERMMPLSKDFYDGTHLLHVIALIHVISGRHPEAIGNLQTLLRIPGVLSANWIRMDPLFAPLRPEPAFQALVGAGS